ncbi:MAG TPA: DUF305 domain-containing protein [Devosia sp.]|nr:DUF305 domain-containing protein [Devosia sp.]
MNLRAQTLAIALLISTGAGTAFAQDSMQGHDMSTMGGHDMSSMSPGSSEMTSGQIQLPEICLAAGEEPKGDMSMGMQHEMDEAHTALMNGMDEMNRQMMIGMMAEDIDVAFVCGMIPHHQSAVNMAKAQLKHGDDPWARELAQSVIENQEQEIADMFAWLEERAAEEISE